MMTVAKIYLLFMATMYALLAARNENETNGIVRGTVLTLTILQFFAVLVLCYGA